MAKNSLTEMSRWPAASVCAVARRLAGALPLVTAAGGASAAIAGVSSGGAFSGFPVFAADFGFDLGCGVFVAMR